MSRQNFLNCARRTVLLAGITVILSSVAFAQAGNATVDVARLVIYRLQYVDASETAAILSQLLHVDEGRLRIRADVSTNSLIVSGTRLDHKVVEEALQLLDIQRQENRPAEQQVKFIPLKEPPNEYFSKILNIVTSGTATDYAIDYSRQLLVARGDETGLNLLSGAVSTLESTAANRSPQGVDNTQRRIRVVWLVGGFDREEAKKPPTDLQHVVEELSKMGISDLSLAAQTIVIAEEPGRPVTASGIATLYTSVEFSFSGVPIPGPGNTTKLEIEIECTSKEGKMSGLNTTVSAPLGHAVVLGVTPMGKMTSVFVVQLLAAD